MMTLQEFLELYRDVIIAKTREMVATRPFPPASTLELEEGIPLFVTQLGDTLRAELSERHVPNAIGSAATRHGARLFELGFTLSQVVHDYGDVCQAVTELAMEQKAHITVEEFHVLNRCLDTAIADAVTEHGRITSQRREALETQRVGHLVHELRAMVNTAMMAFDIIKRGTVSVNGSTGAVLGRSLVDIVNLAETAMADVRLSANQQLVERVPIAAFLTDLALAGTLHAELRGQLFTVEPLDPELCADADPQLLASAVTNVLNNAFKYTRPGGRIVLRAERHEALVRIEVEDECGGIGESSADLFKPFGDRRSANRTGLGLGLSIARRAAKANGGDITISNRPGRGCVFTIEVPVAVQRTAPATT
jgi:signal transduction histidine kinase